MPRLKTEFAAEERLKFDGFDGSALRGLFTRRIQARSLVDMRSPTHSLVFLACARTGEARRPQHPVLGGTSYTSGWLFSFERLGTRLTRPSGVVPLWLRSAAQGSTHDQQSPGNPVADQPDKFPRAGVAPPQLHAATIAQAIGPRMLRKPGVFQCGDTRRPTADGPGKDQNGRSEEHTSELQSRFGISYA